MNVQTQNEKIKPPFQSWLLTVYDFLYFHSTLIVSLCLCCTTWSCVDTTHSLLAYAALYYYAALHHVAVMWQEIMSPASAGPTRLGSPLLLLCRRRIWHQTASATRHSSRRAACLTPSCGESVNEVPESHYFSLGKRCHGWCLEQKTDSRCDGETARPCRC